MLTFIGNCHKHDFVVATSRILKELKQEPVDIITDDETHYGYFEGEISEIKINQSTKEQTGLLVYDCHTMIIPDSLEEHKVVLVTTMHNALNAHALVVIQSDCSITEKYIKSYFSSMERFYYFYDDPRRRIDMVFNSQLNYKKLGNDFTGSIDNMLVDLFEAPSADLKKIWAYLKKRG
jgi:hypothetical protein